jgi:hypothetical protein
MKPLWLSFEVNSKDSTNQTINKPFFQQGQLPEYFINYLSEEREVESLKNEAWPDPPGAMVIDPKFFSTYDYITSKTNQRFNTTDIDYAWKVSENQYKGLETSTFFIPMKTEATARTLVRKFIEKRAAARGAHQFSLLAQVAELEGFDLQLVFMNVESRDSPRILTDANVFAIPLDLKTARQMHQGTFPTNYQFLPWQDWAASL